MSTSKKKPILTVTIQESKWRTGSDGSTKTGKGNTRLLNRSGYMCCLGFACLESGITKNRIRSRSTPYSLNQIIPGLASRSKNGCIKNTVFSNRAITINDSRRTTLEQKKKRLAALGKRHNIKFIFKP